MTSCYLSLDEKKLTGVASCIGLEKTCGPTHDDDCCKSPLVTGGTYARSYDVGSDGMYPDDTRPATVSDFRLDKYEVTVGRFRQFVMAGLGTRASAPNAGAGAHPHALDSGWDPMWSSSLVADTTALGAALHCDSAAETWTVGPGPNESRPINCVSWFEAMAFCIWDGGFLPTEAEWNYAAAGGSEQRAYPWSSPPGALAVDSTRASYFDGTNCVGDELPGCKITDLVVVGTKPVGDARWGQSDLGGNVWEWTLDAYDPYVTPCTDCVDLTRSSERVHRGGGFDDMDYALRVSDRNWASSSYRATHLGIRCARAP